MKHLRRDTLSILGLAALWAISGYILGAFIESMGVAYPVAMILASLNVIMGMFLFLGVTNDPRFERIFFEGPRPTDEGYIPVGCLWVIPLNFLLIGLILWVTTTIIRFILFLWTK